MPNGKLHDFWILLLLLLLDLTQIGPNWYGPLKHPNLLLLKQYYYFFVKLYIKKYNCFGKPQYYHPFSYFFVLCALI